jgi:hypothetical protein
MAVTTPPPANTPGTPSTGVAGSGATSSSSGAANVDQALADAARDAADAKRLADGLKAINMAVMAFMAEVEKANKWFEKAASA